MATLLDRNLTARALVDEAIAKGGLVIIPCTGCGEAVGAYRPGHVGQASIRLPQIRCKCMRRGCREETLITIGEIRGGRFFAP